MPAEVGGVGGGEGLGDRTLLFCHPVPLTLSVEFPLGPRACPGLALSSLSKFELATASSSSSPHPSPILRSPLFLLPSLFPCPLLLPGSPSPPLCFGSTVGQVSLAHSFNLDFGRQSVSLSLSVSPFSHLFPSGSIPASCLCCSLRLSSPQPQTSPLFRLPFPPLSLQLLSLLSRPLPRPPSPCHWSVPLLPELQWGPSSSQPAFSPPWEARRLWQPAEAPLDDSRAEQPSELSPRKSHTSA